MNTEPTITAPAPLIVLFDGTCGLCDRAVRFILKRDPHQRFRFASQQSPAGQDLLKKHELDPEKLQSVVLIDNDKAYTKSAALARIAVELPDPWPLAAAIIFIPAELRDSVYDYIAAHRHQWFKPPDACRAPNEAERERFL
jgi:predicted DCC family thiol-disulfide oxidoreductase YuxK